MNTERTEKFVNAIACDLEEGGFRQVSGTTLRRTLATAVSAALPLLAEQQVGEVQGDARSIIEEFVQCAALGRPHGKLIAQAKDYLAARQPVDDGFQSAFYEIGDMLGMTAQPRSPKEVWETQMRPALEAKLAGQARQPTPMGWSDTDFLALGNPIHLRIFRKAVMRFKVMAELGVDVESMPMHFMKSQEKYAADVIEANRLLALIDSQRDAAPGVGNG